MKVQNKKAGKIIWLMAFMLIVLLILPMISAAVSFCCEKTNSGGFCLNSPKEMCNSAFKITQTSCDSTSYCKRGCCYEAKEGECSENTPLKVCENAGGTWSESPSCDIPQCRYGCCLLGDQAALTTLTKCKSLSTNYNLEMNFRQDITDETICIATANAQDKGACVFAASDTGERTCTFTTRVQCGAEAGGGKEFYKDVLCTAPELGTICTKQQKTMMIEGRDEIYYKDSCGNPANIYNADRYNDDSYWRNVYTKAQSCGYGLSNAGSKICGNCDYFLGSIGKQKGFLIGSPTYGDYICVDLSCNGHQHGESWCAYDSGSAKGDEKVGNLHYKQVCLNNEVIVERCDDFRNEVCIQNTISGFTEAACRPNRWRDCVLQADEDDCKNTDIRDCKWISGYYFSAQGTGVQPVDDSSEEVTPEGLCVPKNAPGFNFWGGEASATELAKASGAKTTQTGVTGKAVDTETEDAAATPAKTDTSFSGGTSASGTNTGGNTGGFAGGRGTGAVEIPSSAEASADICSAANSQVTLKFKGKYGNLGKAIADVFGDVELEWECEGNKRLCEMAGDNPKGVDAEKFGSWVDDMNSICNALGDCGGKSNWIGARTEDGYAAYYQQERFAGKGGAEKTEAAPATGQAIADFFRGLYSKASGKEEEGK